MNARVFLLLLPLAAETATLNIDCDAGDTIQDALTRVKPADTIVVSGTCNARAKDLSPNTIQNNGLDGIVVQRSSTAWIAGNIVRGNKLNGIVVDRHSQATIGGNAIDDNGGDAIAVSRLSGVTLGSMGARRDGPNGTRRNNNGVGIRCFMGGYVDGSAGTLSGARGEKHFENACIDGLTP